MSHGLHETLIIFLKKPINCFVKFRIYFLIFEKSEKLFIVFYKKTLKICLKIIFYNNFLFFKTKNIEKYF